MSRAPFAPPIFLEKIYWGLRFKQWLKRVGGESVPYFGERFEIYQYLNNSVLKEAAIDYLEFGVAEGNSIREWTRINPLQNSRFFGFDTFEGLPEHWKHFNGKTPKGSFSTRGQPPLFRDDSRVQWLVGMFQDTLPSFLETFQVRNELIIHLDADLYSSTLYALVMLDRFLRHGAIIVFDEFASFDNEFRALEDFAAAFRRSYRVLACGGPFYDKVAIQFTRLPNAQ